MSRTDSACLLRSRVSIVLPADRTLRSIVCVKRPHLFTLDIPVLPLESSWFVWMSQGPGTVANTSLYDFLTDLNRTVLLLCSCAGVGRFRREALVVMAVQGMNYERPAGQGRTFEDELVHKSRWKVVRCSRPVVPSSCKRRFFLPSSCAS